MFWDGSRWVSETPPAQPTDRRRLADWLATGVMGVALFVMVVPLGATSAATPVRSRALIDNWSSTHETAMVNETSRSLRYSGSWRRADHADYIGGHVRSSDVKGSKVSLTFTGSGVSWIGPVGPTRGTALVYLDGRKIKTVSTFGSRFLPARVLFRSTWGSVDSHRISIIVNGTKGHPTVAVDAFVIRGAEIQAAATPVPATEVPAITEPPATEVPAATPPATEVPAATPPPATQAPATSAPDGTPTAEPTGTPITTSAPTATPKATGLPVSGTPPPVTTPAPTPAKTPAPAPSSTPTPSVPILSFADEFDGNGLDDAWVNIYPGPGDPGFGSNSDFMGDTRQVSVANGIATITAQRMQTPSGHEYASGIIGTRFAFSQMYGTWEARIRYPAGQGVWPAFWMLAAGKNTPPPEVDIFEAYPAPPGPGGGSGVEYLGAGLYGDDGTEHFLYYHPWALTGVFHVHKMVWTPTKMSFYVDGMLRGVLDDVEKFPQGPMYPIVNLAMGVPGIYEVDGTTPDTVKMDIDYVRVYAP